MAKKTADDQATPRPTRARRKATETDEAGTATAVAQPLDEAAAAADDRARDERISEASDEGEPSHDEIATRAYYRYLERGGHHGAHLDDWYEAERDLKTSRRK
jgi:hypothetical protein